MTKSEILIVDDEPATLFAFSEYLSGAGYTVKQASSIADARGLLSARQFDAVILDVRLPDGSGIDLIAELKERSPVTAVIVITGLGNIPLAVEAMRLGADNFLTKPVNLPDIEVFLHKSLEIGALRRKNLTFQRLTKREDIYSGQGPAMKQVMELAAIASRSTSSVMIIGETGTGKGVLARWVHDQSEQRSRAFVDVNCSALKGDLLATELFGHVKGSFTSAAQDKQGLIEVADGGTLFLDEIGDMDLTVQAQMLKVIEEKQYRRLGDTTVRKSDFRLICATNRDIEQGIADGGFRRDLYFRINVLHISVPPLRDRKEDIPGLAAHILGKLGASAELTPEIVRILNGYPWPGNTRELRNILERALLLAQGGPLQPVHFAGISVPGESAHGNPGGLSALEKEYLSKTLADSGGDAKKAAEFLGMPLSTFYRKVKKHGIT